MTAKEGKMKKDIWKDIKTGDVVSFKVVIDEKKVADFAFLSGDKNPLHFDKKVAKERGLGKPISHGMLLAAYFSTLVGCYFLKDHNLYLAQNIDFIRPVFVGEAVIVKGEVKNKIESLRILEIKTVIVNTEGKNVVKGSAKVKYI